MILPPPASVIPAPPETRPLLSNRYTGPTTWERAVNSRCTTVQRPFSPSDGSRTRISASHSVPIRPWPCPNSAAFLGGRFNFLPPFRPQPESGLAERRYRPNHLKRNAAPDSGFRRNDDEYETTSLMSCRHFTRHSITRHSGLCRNDEAFAAVADRINYPVCPRKSVQKRHKAAVAFLLPQFVHTPQCLLSTYG